jgi:plastin-1
VRWFNYHLKKNGVDKKVTNLGKDLADGTIWTHLLNSIDSNQCSLAPLEEENILNRC